ncbi:4Fe-4S binding protein [Desulfosarcina sp. OttesenSCG-928-A07]|nr:4Fe-4S binding protein [Desulfosarcina sp. OttesenSCG-928-G17]MDL2328999.1 4Fe-4S binding protein [Desulfosarcina sp. OttesenSCG-928-A07]
MAIKKKQKPVVNAVICAACGECAETCPRCAISIQCGVSATLDDNRCAGCGACAAACPASAIRMEEA